MTIPSTGAWCRVLAQHKRSCLLIGRQKSPAIFEAARMSQPFQLTPQAIEDLDTIWWRVADDSRVAAERIEPEIIATFHRLSQVSPQCQTITCLSLQTSTAANS